MMDIGLLLNFGMNTMKEGIVRVVNNDHPSASSAVSAGDKNKLKGSRVVRGWHFARCVLLFVIILRVHGL